MNPIKCPVCNGTMLVPASFYSLLRDSGSVINTMPERCRSCVNGIVWPFIHPNEVKAKENHSKMIDVKIDQPFTCDGKMYVISKTNIASRNSNLENGYSIFTLTHLTSEQ